MITSTRLPGDSIHKKMAIFGSNKQLERETHQWLASMPLLIKSCTECVKMNAWSTIKQMVHIHNWLIIIRQHSGDCLTRWFPFTLCLSSKSISGKYNISYIHNYTYTYRVPPKKVSFWNFRFSTVRATLDRSGTEQYKMVPNDLKRAIAVQKVHNLPKLSKMIQIVQNLKIQKVTCFGDTLYSALTYNTHLVIPDLWNHCGLKQYKMLPVLNTHLVACTRDTLHLEWELEQQVGVVCLVHLRLCV